MFKELKVSNVAGAEATLCRVWGTWQEARSSSEMRQCRWQPRSLIQGNGQGRQEDRGMGGSPGLAPNLEPTLRLVGEGLLLL